MFFRKDIIDKKTNSTDRLLTKTSAKVAKCPLFLYFCIKKKKQQTNNIS